MRPYRDALKFFGKYLAIMGITALLMGSVEVFLEAHIPAPTLGCVLIFGPFIVWYFLLVRLLKRYIDFYTDIKEIRAEIQTPYAGQK